MFATSTPGHNSQCPNLLTFSDVETFAIRAMLRLGDVGKGVNAVGVDAQGATIFSG